MIPPPAEDMLLARYAQFFRVRLTYDDNLFLFLVAHHVPHLLFGLIDADIHLQNSKL